MTFHSSGCFTSLTDLEICTLALCATITVCTIGVVFVVVSVMVGVIENSTKRVIHAAWHGLIRRSPIRSSVAPMGYRYFLLIRFL